MHCHIESYADCIFYVFRHEFAELNATLSATYSDQTDYHDQNNNASPYTSYSDQFVDESLLGEKYWGDHVVAGVDELPSFVPGVHASHLDVEVVVAVVDVAVYEFEIGDCLDYVEEFC